MHWHAPSESVLCAGAAFYPTLLPDFSGFTSIPTMHWSPALRFREYKHAPKMHPAFGSEQQICSCGKHAFALDSKTHRPSFYQLPNRRDARMSKVPGDVIQIAWSPSACTAAITYEQDLGDRSRWGLRLVSHEGRVLREHYIPEVEGWASDGFVWSPAGDILAAMVREHDTYLHRLWVVDITMPCGRLHPINVRSKATWYDWYQADRGAPQDRWRSPYGCVWQWVPGQLQVGVGSSPCDEGCGKLVVWGMVDDEYEKLTGAVVYVLQRTSGNSGNIRFSVSEGPLEWGQPWLRGPVWGLGGMLALDEYQFPCILTDVRPQKCLVSTEVLQDDVDMDVAWQAWQPVALEGTSESFHLEPSKFRYREYESGIACAWSPTTRYLGLACRSGPNSDELMLHLVDGFTGVAKYRIVLMRQEGLSYLAKSLRVQWNQRGTAVCVSVILGSDEFAVRKFLVAARR